MDAAGQNGFPSYKDFPNPAMQQSINSSPSMFHPQAVWHGPHAQQQQMFPQSSINPLPNGQMVNSNISWQNQIPMQPFMNGMHPAMGMQTFGQPFLPQAMAQDVYPPVQPVGPSDEPTLVRVLVNAHRGSESYKDALNSLHLQGGHHAGMWKDYYLEHKKRLDHLVEAQLASRSSSISASLQTVKKPTPDQFGADSSPAPVKQKVKPSALKKARASKSHTISPPPASGRHRRTINSLTAPSPVFNTRLPPPHTDIIVPEPPSRSPTPSTTVIRGSRGNKFTEEDQTFFHKFIAWRLKHDSSLTRNELCEMLADKAPHHTAQSWGSYWSNHHDLPDKILAAAKGEEYGDDESELSSEEASPRPTKRPRYDYATTSEEEEDEQSNAEGSDEGESASDSDDEDFKIPKYDPSEMGPKGGPFTDADFVITARHIAKFENFRDTGFQDKWVPFGEKYPQRSAKAWAEYYRRNEQELDKLARRIRKAKRRRSSPPKRGRS